MKLTARDRTRRPSGTAWGMLLVGLTLAAALCLAAGCPAERPQAAPETPVDRTESVVPSMSPAALTANAELVRSAVGCEPERAEAAALVLDRLKVGRLDSVAEVESSRKGPVLIARAGDRSYVIFMRKDGFLETVKAESIDGNTLYQVMY